MADMGRGKNEGGRMSRGTSDAVGEGVGGVSGVVAGAAIGSLGGPVGTVIGGIAGAVGGWWAGKKVADAATGYTDDADTCYRKDFESRGNGRFKSYDEARPLYQFGHIASQNPDYEGRSFSDISPELERGWNKDLERQYGSWKDVSGTVGNAFESGKNELRVTRSEEELVIGKREVQAGEVGLRKTVETERVSEKVPLMHEEVEVERHAVNADSKNRDVDIGEQQIRVPLMAEEAVVNKRVVAKEEIQVGKHAVEETREVKADLRRERVDVDKGGSERIGKSGTHDNSDEELRSH